MLATAGLGKKALLLAQGLAPNITINLLKYEGMLTDGWKPFIKIIPFADRSYRVEVNHSGVPADFPLEKFQEKFADAAAAWVPDDIKWV